MKKLRPLHDRLIVKRDEAPKKTPGGILLPDQAQDKPTSGKVVAVGDGERTRDGDRMKLDVQPGDKVWFSTYAGNEIEIDGEKILILREADVLAVES